MARDVANVIPTMVWLSIIIIVDVYAGLAILIVKDTVLIVMVNNLNMMTLLIISPLLLILTKDGHLLHKLQVNNSNRNSNNNNKKVQVIKLFLKYSQLQTTK